MSSRDSARPQPPVQDLQYFTVVPSPESETIIRILRTTPKSPKKDRPTHHKTNPYIFQPKSYSKNKRGQRVPNPLPTSQGSLLSPLEINASVLNDDHNGSEPMNNMLDLQTPQNLGRTSTDPSRTSGQLEDILPRASGSDSNSPDVMQMESHQSMHIEEGSQDSRKNIKSDQSPQQPLEPMDLPRRSTQKYQQTMSRGSFPSESLATKKKKLTSQELKPAETMVKPKPIILHDPSSFFTKEFFESYKSDDETSKQIALKYNNTSVAKFPSMDIELEELDELNFDVLKTIEIVSNKNQKYTVPIHKALLQAFTGMKQEPTKDFSDHIVNFFNIPLREQAMKKVTFLSDYRSGYAPIELQENNADHKDFEHRTGRGHFIRTKQKTLTLPRNCGVSYVKPTESSQGPPWSPLSPLIFQCSSECDPHFEANNRQKLSQSMDKWLRYMEEDWLLYVQSDEDHMRQLLLGQKHGKIGWIRGIQNLWPLMSEGIFLVVAVLHKFSYDEESMWSDFHNAEIKIGALIKKSTSGKQAVFSSIGIDDLKEYYCEDVASVDQTETHMETAIAEELKQETVDTEKKHPVQKVKAYRVDPKYKNNSQLKEVDDELLNMFVQYINQKNMVTLSIKLEMYVNQNKWKRYSQETKNILNTMMMRLKNQMEKRVLDIMQKRIKLSKADIDKVDILAQEMENIRVLKETVISLKSGGEAGTPPVSDLTVTHVQDLIQMVTDFREVRNDIYKYSEKMDIKDYLAEYVPDSLKEKKLPKIKKQPKEPKEPKELTKADSKKENAKESRRYNSSSEDPIDKALGLRLPLYFINTRDSFAFDLITEETIIERMGRRYRRIQYFFQPNNLPANYDDFKKLFPKNEVGVVCYHDFFTDQELKHFESSTFQTQKKAFKNTFLQMTVQPTIAANKVRRTKFFFGYRYMWTKTQIAEPYSYVGAGVRKDVTPAPSWVKSVEAPLVQHGIVEPDFINSVAINVYHDGKQGLAQHFDDAVRFKQPIYTVRLFSDARLSFGSQFYGFCNGAFVIPLPRGCICVMTQNSYAANGVKHCVRPCDMTGKSAAMILRQMHSLVTTQVQKYDTFVDFPLWFSTLSTSPEAVSYADQKKREAQYLEHVKALEEAEAQEQEGEGKKTRTRRPRCKKGGQEAGGTCNGIETEIPELKACPM